MHVRLASLTLRKISENRVLRRLNGPDRKWPKSGEDCTMRSFITSYTTPKIIRMTKSRRMLWTGHVACMELKVRTNFDWKTWWEQTTLETDLKIGFEDVDWIHLTKHMDQQRALVKMIMNIQVPQNAGKFLTSRMSIIPLLQPSTTP